MTETAIENIRLLSQSNVSQVEFCQRLLEELCAIFGAKIAIAWNVSGQQAVPVGQYPKDGAPTRLDLSQEAHTKLLTQAIAREKPSAVVLKSGNADGGSILLMGKYQRLDVYLIELVLDANPEQAQERELTARFASVLETVSVETAKNVDLQAQIQPDGTANAPAAEVLNQAQVSGYLDMIHGSIDKATACSNVANETRRIFDCDRVSIAIAERGKFRIVSISGQPSVNRRSSTTKLLEKLTRRLLKTGQPFWYPSEAEIPSQISVVLDEYLSLSATRSLIVQPIHSKKEELVTDPDSLESKKDPVIGGIIFEHCRERWERSKFEPAIEFATLHGGNAIRNAHQHHNLFLYPVMNLLGKSRVLMSPRLLPKTLLVLAGLLIAGLILAFWPVDFYVSADGVLVPKEMQPIFAKVDGDVTELLVDHGSNVKKGQTLLVLASQEHQIRQKETESKIRSTVQRLETLEDQRFEQREDNQAVQDNVESLKSLIENYKEQQVILESITQKMEVTSPVDGRVISWDLKQRLHGRAIQRGQELMEVATVEGDWELEIELPIRRYSHLIAELRDTKEPRISFLLAADTSKRYEGKIVVVEQTASLSASNEQVIKLRAALENSDLEITQARTGVTAKIYCGQTSLGYFLFHDVGEFLQKNVFFYLQ